MIWLLRALSVAVLVPSVLLTIGYGNVVISPKATGRQTFKAALLFVAPAAVVAFLAGAFLVGSFR